MAVSCSGAERGLESFVGDNARDGVVGKARETLDAFGVFTGEDFVGDIDLARSDALVISVVLASRDV
jgi:hypothetical protein